MKGLRSTLILTILVALAPPQASPVPSHNSVLAPRNAAASPENPFVIVARKHEALRALPLGAILPGGWLKAQILSNLRGFTGHLDSLAPGLIIRDDIYGRDRLTRNIKRKTSVSWPAGINLPRCNISGGIARPRATGWTALSGARC